MRRARLAALGLLLVPSACSTLLGYDSGTPGSADGGGNDGATDVAGDTHVGTDGPLADGKFDAAADADGAAGSESAPPTDSSVPDVTGDAPMMPETSPVDSAPVDSTPPVDAPADMSTPGDAGITCTGCPGATTTYFVQPLNGAILTGIALDNANVYYAEAPIAGGGTIYKSPKSDGTMRTAVVSGVANHVDSPAGVATDGVHVYWASSTGAGGVYFCPTSGACTPTADQTPGPVLGLALAATGERYIGFTNGAVDQCGAPMSCNAVGGSPPQAGVYGIAVGGTTFFWGYAEGATNNIWAAPTVSISLDQSIQIDTGEAIAGMALSGSMTLYWVTQGGSLKKCAATNTPSCGPVTPIASGLMNPVGVAVDGFNLYLTVNEATGQGIFKMPLP